PARRPHPAALSVRRHRRRFLCRTAGAGRPAAPGRAVVPSPARRTGSRGTQERAASPGFAAAPGPLRCGAVVGVVLRPMSLHDISAVAVLEQDLFGVEAWSPELLAGEVTADPANRYYLVAEDEGAVTGYGGLMAQSGGQADVLTLAVASDRWGE